MSLELGCGAVGAITFVKAIVQQHPETLRWGCPGAEVGFRRWTTLRSIANTTGSCHLRFVTLGLVRYQIVGVVQWRSGSSRRGSWLPSLDNPQKDSKHHLQLPFEGRGNWFSSVSNRCGCPVTVGVVQVRKLASVARQPPEGFQTPPAVAT